MPIKVINNRYGSQLNRRVAAHPDHCKVECPACGAAKGSSCRGKDGSKITNTHAVRADRVRAKKAGRR